MVTHKVNPMCWWHLAISSRFMLKFMLLTCFYHQSTTWWSMMKQLWPKWGQQHGHCHCDSDQQAKVINMSILNFWVILCNGFPDMVGCCFGFQYWAGYIFQGAPSLYAIARVQPWQKDVIALIPVRSRPKLAETETFAAMGIWVSLLLGGHTGWAPQNYVTYPAT